MRFYGRRRQQQTPPVRSLFSLVAAVLLVSPTASPGQPSLDAGIEEEVLEEIIVTARKIEENILRVPLSVHAIPGDFVDSAGLSSLYEMQFDVPGLVVTNAGMFGAGISLRGVTDEGGGSLAVAPHVDGIYMGRSNLALARLFDVQRVEVLKGPQGTLYGRNATGGSINVINRRPADKFSATVETAFGSFETVRVQGHVNLPSERVSVRLAAAGSGGDGYIRNSIDDRSFAEDDWFGVRGSIRLRPAQGLTIDLLAQHVEDDGAMGELWLPRKDFLADPGDIWLTTVTLANPFLSTRNDVASADLVYDSDNVVFRSISGYARNVTRGLDDCAGVPMLKGCTREVHPLDYEQWSQEIHLGSRVDSSLDWLVGLFLLDAETSTNFRFSAPLLGAGPINDYASLSEESAYAAFGQATHDINERWSVTAGLRKSHEKHSVSRSGTGTADSPALMTAEGAWDKTSWRLSVQYAPSADALVYASAATGFKSGGITTELLPSGEFDSFDPEQLIAYEIGLNLHLAGPRRTLAASAFLYDFQDLQVRTTAIVGNQVTTVVDNAANARIHGLDLSTAIDIGDRLTLSGSVVWTPKREFVKFRSAEPGSTLSGNMLSRAPEWTASASIDYLMPLGDIGDLVSRIDYNYRSAFFFTKENDPIASQEGFGLLNLSLRLDSSNGSWYLFGNARNLLDTGYFNQVFLQSSPGLPENYEVGFGLHF